MTILKLQSATNQSIAFNNLVCGFFLLYNNVVNSFNREGVLYNQKKDVARIKNR
jgi:hypothetical protein